jgi:hypothetical protein
LIRPDASERALDDAAYVRFASVESNFREVKDLKQYGFGSNRHRHSEERSDEASQDCDAALDCFASLAMTTRRLDLKSSRSNTLLDEFCTTRQRSLP